MSVHFALCILLVAFIPAALGLLLSKAGFVLFPTESSRRALRLLRPRMVIVGAVVAVRGCLLLKERIATVDSGVWRCSRSLHSRNVHNDRLANACRLGSGHRAARRGSAVEGFPWKKGSLVSEPLHKRGQRSSSTGICLTPRIPLMEGSRESSSAWTLAEV